MTRRSAWLLTLAFLAVWAVISAEPMAGMPSTDTARWDFDGSPVRAAMTPELVRAICGPTGELVIFEDHTYTCGADNLARVGTSRLDSR